MASHFGITSISDTPHILQSMFFGWDDTRIMPAVFRCVFLAMQPSLCLTMWSSPLAMVICDLWDSPIKRKKWTMDGSCSNYGESYPRIHRLFWGMGFTPLCHEFFFFVESLWMFIFTKDPWWNRIETTGSWAPGQWMPTLRLGASGGDEKLPVYFWAESWFTQPWS